MTRPAILKVTDDWFAARNTLTHRQLGPISTATIQLAYSSLSDGDRAGLGLFRDQSAYIGIWRTGSTFTVNMVDSIVMNTDNFTTTSTGTTEASASVSGGTIWLRVISDSSPGGDSATFWYSQDGTTFTQLGPAFACDENWEYFEGQRFAIFNFATNALGGSAHVADFELAAGSYTGAAVGASASSAPASTQTSKASSPTTTSAASGGGGSGWCDFRSPLPVFLYSLGPQHVVALRSMRGNRWVMFPQPEHCLSACRFHGLHNVRERVNLHLRK